jgi:hypothetical protein
VTAADGFAACYRGVTVRIQRRASGRWRTVELTTTDATGLYRERIPDVDGRYRAVTRKLDLGTDICVRARSRVVVHG